MSSLYLRGQTWWAKSYEQGKMIRWSLKTTSKAEARRKLRESESQRRAQPRGTPARGEATWQEAVGDLMTYYRAYGTRDLKQARYKLGVLSQYFHEAALRTIDAPAILGFVAHRRSAGRAAATINVELATLRKALRLAQAHGKLDRVPRIHMLRPAPSRAGFFEPAQFEAVMRGHSALSQGVARIETGVSCTSSLS
jgi:hypothetical protein